MADEGVEWSSIAPAIPVAGLREVLSAWSGKGELLDALAAASDVDHSDWSDRDILRRANRVLFPDLARRVGQLPSSLSAWMQYLPAATTRARYTADRPLGGVSWVETRGLGWPPRVFSGHLRERGADMLVVTALRWTLEAVLSVRADACRLDPAFLKWAVEQFDALEVLLQVEPVASASPVAPSHVDLTALSREGWPWSDVADVAQLFVDLDDCSLETLARRLIAPDEDLRWRLFHLGVFGTVLTSLRALGVSAVSRHPLAAGATGPTYVFTTPEGARLDLWFEAAGAWRRYVGGASPYMSAAAGVRGESRPLGADILLVEPGRRAMVIECKYSPHPAQVSRVGYHQATCYAAELKAGIAPDVQAIVVGPHSVIDRYADTELPVGRVGIGPPECISERIRSFLFGGGEPTS